MRTRSRETSRGIEGPILTTRFGYGLDNDSRANALTCRAFRPHIFEVMLGVQEGEQEAATRPNSETYAAVSAHEDSRYCDHTDRQRDRCVR